MGIALRNRLNGNKEDFLKDIETYGDLGALDKWRNKLDGYHDLVGLRRFLDSEGKDENFGRYPKPGSYYRGGIKSVFQEFVSTFVSRVLLLEKQNELLTRQLESYRDNGHKAEMELAEQIMSITEGMKV